MLQMQCIKSPVSHPPLALGGCVFLMASALTHIWESSGSDGNMFVPGSTLGEPVDLPSGKYPSVPLSRLPEQDCVCPPHPLHPPPPHRCHYCSCTGRGCPGSGAIVQHRSGCLQGESPLLQSGLVDWWTGIMSKKKRRCSCSVRAAFIVTCCLF